MPTGNPISGARPQGTRMTTGIGLGRLPGASHARSPLPSSPLTDPRVDDEFLSDEEVPPGETAYTHLTMQPAANHGTAILSASPNQSHGKISGGASTDGGSTGGANGGGGPKKPSAEKLQKANALNASLRRDITSFWSAGECLKRIEADLKVLSGDRPAELAYIQGVGDLFTRKNVSHITANDRIRVLHFIALRFDTLTENLSVRGFAGAAKPHADYAQVFKPIVAATTPIEKELLWVRSIDGAVAGIFADIEWINARKAHYYSAVRGDDTHPLNKNLALTILRAHTARRRYEQLAISVRTRTIDDFLGEVKAIHKLPSDERKWAIDLLASFIEQFATRAVATRDERLITSLKIELENMTEGFAPYSHILYSRAAAVFEREGMVAWANEFKRLPLDDLELARTLRLSD